MKKTVFLIAVVILLIFFAGCSDSTPSKENTKDAIKFSGETSVRTSFLTGTKTITIDGTFINTGRSYHTFWGGLTVYDTDYHDAEYKGEIITLAPGEGKTIREVFVMDYSFDFKGVAYDIRGT